MSHSLKTLKMDSVPKQADEPKAPDKETLRPNEKEYNSKIKAVARLTNSVDYNKDCDKMRLNSKPTNPSVSSLDESSLKALLEEAMAYKRPKDVQGKSELFKELLHSVETDNKYPNIERPEKQNSKKLRRRQQLTNARKECDKSSSTGSLQDLAQAAEDASKLPQRAKHRATLWKTCGQESVTNAPYKTEDDNEVVVTNGNCGGAPNIYELRQFVGNEANVFRIVEPETVQNSASPLTGALKSADDINGECTDDNKNSACVADEKDKNYLNCEAINREGNAEKKNVDENGNALGTNSEYKRKPRRLKANAKNDKNTILSQHIEGHRSDIAEDIDALMKYIESPKHDDDKRGRQMFSKNSAHIVGKLHQRDKSSETLRKGRKNKDSQLQKSTSLEEVSVSKFEDLTKSEETKPSKFDSEIKSPVSKCDKPSWSKQEQSICRQRDLTVSSVINLSSKVIDANEFDVQDAEFHTVTKKQKKKKVPTFYSGKRSSGRVYHSSGYRHDYKSDCKHFYAHDNKQRGGFYFKNNRNYHRRKSTSSVPSSDKSGECSDLDSVHSLPISTTKATRNNERRTDAHNTYADITRAVPSPVRAAMPELSGNDENCDKKKLINEKKIPELGQSVDKKKITNEKGTLESVPTADKNKVPDEKAFPELAQTVDKKKVLNEKAFPELVQIVDKKKVTIDKGFPELVQTVDKKKVINEKSSCEFVQTVDKKKVVDEKSSTELVQTADKKKDVNEKSSTELVQTADKKKAASEKLVPEIIPTVTISLPKKREKNNFSPEEYPPLIQHSDDMNPPLSPSCKDGIVSAPSPVMMNTPSIRSVNENDIYVEYTFKLPKKLTPKITCCDVEETVIIKLPPKNVSENSSKLEESQSKRPAVILTSEFDNVPTVDDLEFGFEVNQQLLRGTSPTETVNITIAPEVEVPLVETSSEAQTCQDNYENKVLKGSTAATHDDIVGYVSADWDRIQSECDGKVQYFSP